MSVEGPVVRQFQQCVVPEVLGITKIGQAVFGGAIAQQGCGLLVQQAGLTDQVQAHVGQSDVFFNHWAVTAPFGVALAQHHGVVGQVQQVVRCRAHHMCPTSSGIS